MDVFTVDDLSALISAMKMSGKQTITMADVASNLGRLKLERTVRVKLSDDSDSASQSDPTFQHNTREAHVGTYVDISNTTPSKEIQNRSRSRTLTSSGGENIHNSIDSDSKRIRKDDLNYGPFRNDDMHEFDSSFRNSNDSNESTGVFSPVTPPATSKYLSGIQNYGSQQINTANMRRNFKLKKSPQRPTIGRLGPFSSSGPANETGDSPTQTRTLLSGLANDISSSSVFFNITAESSLRGTSDSFPDENFSGRNTMNMEKDIATAKTTAASSNETERSMPDFTNGISPANHVNLSLGRTVEKLENSEKMSPRDEAAALGIGIIDESYSYEEEDSDFIPPPKLIIIDSASKKTVTTNSTNVLPKQEQGHETISRGLPELYPPKILDFEQKRNFFSFDNIPVFGSRSAPVDLSAEEDEEKVEVGEREGEIFYDRNIEKNADDVAPSWWAEGNKDNQDFDLKNNDKDNMVKSQRDFVGTNFENIKNEKKKINGNIIKNQDFSFNSSLGDLESDEDDSVDDDDNNNNNNDNDNTDNNNYDKNNNIDYDKNNNGYHNRKISYTLIDKTNKSNSSNIKYHTNNAQFENDLNQNNLPNRNKASFRGKTEFSMNNKIDLNSNSALLL